MHTKIKNTKQALLLAYCELLKSCTPQEITVAELCRKANINRTTFYKYYAVPDDIIAEKADEYISDFLSPTLGDTRINTYEHLLHICEVLKSNAWLLALYTLGGKDLLTLVQKILPFNTEQNIERDHRYIFVSGGVAALLLQWMLNGCKQSPAVMARLLADSIELNMK